MKKYLKTIMLSGILAFGGTVVPAVADNIKIGFNVPLTGFAAADGQSALHGAELAVKQVNGSGGVNGKMLELVVYDDQASPKESAPLAVKMITKMALLRVFLEVIQVRRALQLQSLLRAKFRISLLTLFIQKLLGPVIMFSEHLSWVRFKAELAQN